MFYVSLMAGYKEMFSNKGLICCRTSGQQYPGACAVNPKSRDSAFQSRNLSNISHKPGGGNVTIVNRKFDYRKVKAKIKANRKPEN
jgi:hypothetical protein